MVCFYVAVSHTSVAVSCKALHAVVQAVECTCLACRSCTMHAAHVAVWPMHSLSFTLYNMTIHASPGGGGGGGDLPSVYTSCCISIVYPPSHAASRSAAFGSNVAWEAVSWRKTLARALLEWCVFVRLTILYGAPLLRDGPERGSCKCYPSRAVLFVGSG